MIRANGANPKLGRKQIRQITGTNGALKSLLSTYALSFAKYQFVGAW